MCVCVCNVSTCFDVGVVDFIWLHAVCIDVCHYIFALKEVYLDCLSSYFFRFCVLAYLYLLSLCAHACTDLTEGECVG